MFKKIQLMCLSIFLMIIPLSVVNVFAESNIPSRTINIVYDDSGSMIYEDGYVDTWCQAKYAMEVVASMLGEKDTLNIFYMSNYEKGAAITLKGSKEKSVIQANVAKVHNYIPAHGETPFGAVKKANEALKKATSDEKWLLVFTDGAFNNTESSTVKNYYENECVNEHTKVMMLAIGAKTDDIEANESRGIYFSKAKTNTEILSKLTSMCNQIFQNNVLDMNQNNISFDVPMSQLTVFAQGENVSINSITDNKKKQISPSSNVNVMYSTKATSKTGNSKYGNPANWVVAKNLKGSVATFNGDFQPGEYVLDVTGADDVQVYYKPNIKIAAYLYEGDKKVSLDKNLVSGNYDLKFEFENPTTNKILEASSLLGEINYSAKMTNTDIYGETTVTEVKNGDNIKLKQGKVSFDVQADYLKYNSIKDKLSYDVFARSDLFFEAKSQPTYELTTEGLKGNDQPIVMHVKLNDGDADRELSSEQWKLLKVDCDAKGVDFKVEKTKEVGTLNIYPLLHKDDVYSTSTGDIKMNIGATYTQGKSTGVGKISQTLRITNKISFMTRFINWWLKNWWKVLLGLLILFLLIGYTFGKKRLSRKLKKKPLIIINPDDTNFKVKASEYPKERTGKFTKDLMTVILPYVPEEGTISLTGTGVTLRVKAIQNFSRMEITNIKKFESDKDIKFDNLTPNKINYIGGRTKVVKKKDGFKYTCYLDRTKEKKKNKKNKRGKRR